MTTSTVPTRPSAPAPARVTAHETAPRQQALRKRPLFDPPIVKRAIRDAFVKLDPRHMVRNPVMFVVLLGSAYTTAVLFRDIAAGRADWGFTLQLTLWLWFTVVFANFAEAMAEGRGKAQADSLRKSRTTTSAKRLYTPDDRNRFQEVKHNR
jgi:K+-transporting ATPase ATPase B chain